LILLASYVDGKKGYATFKVKDALTKKEITINNSHFLTTFQEKQMAFPA
jgi:hypothetical protein